MSTSASSSGSKISKRVEKELHQRKVVIRRLPPDFTEEKLREKIEPFPDHVYFYFCPGDPSLGNLGFSRAYIAFEREEDILPFRNSYDGMLLEGEKGGKYRAIVEFSPYQGIPKKGKRKVDTRCGTIDKDLDYLAFMQSVESRPEPRPSIQLESYLEELEASRVADVQVTPLIEYLKDKMSGRGGRGRGRVDAKKKRKGESSSGKGKGYKSSKGGPGSTSSSKSRDSTAKGKKEKESEGLGRSGSSTKLAGEDGGNTKGGATQRVSSSSRQEKKDKYRGSERKEAEQEGAEGGEDKEGRRNKHRNRDRPDRSIYVPKSRNTGGGGGEREGRDSSKEYQGRGGRGKQGRPDDSSDYGGRPRSRGRGRGYRRGSGQAQESAGY